MTKEITGLYDQTDREMLHFLRGWLRDRNDPNRVREMIDEHFAAQHRKRAEAEA